MTVCCAVSYIDHVFFNTVIQFTTALIEDVYIQNLSVIIQALADSHSWIAI